MRTVLIHSGGLDSTVLLHALVKRMDRQVHALAFNYGQRHGEQELLRGFVSCNKLGVERKLVDLSCLKPLLAGSSQTDDSIPVPEGHYAEASMKATVVPNRNMVMLSIAAAWAISLKADEIAYAAHAGDHAIYPDCRPEFVDALEEAIKLADWHRVFIKRPFINLKKQNIVALGHEMGVSFKDTYSCYNGRPKHCGKCGTCVERIEAFKLAEVPDPTEYEA